MQPVARFLPVRQSMSMDGEMQIHWKNNNSSATKDSCPRTPSELSDREIERRRDRETDKQIDRETKRDKERKSSELYLDHAYDTIYVFRKQKTKTM